MNCAAESCVNNDKGLCVVESMLSICEDSKCALYQTSPEKQISVLTKKVEMLTEELKRSCEENEELMKQIEEFKKSAVYPPVGTTVWVEDAMWGIIQCKVDQPFHYKTGNDCGWTFEGSFTLADIGEFVFLSYDACRTKQAEAAEKYSDENTKDKKRNINKFLYAKDYE